MTPEQLKEIRDDIKQARIWAAENLPTKSGLAMIHKLEKIMAKISTH